MKWISHWSLRHPDLWDKATRYYTGQITKSIDEKLLRELLEKENKKMSLINDYKLGPRKTLWLRSNENCNENGGEFVQIFSSRPWVKGDKFHPRPDRDLNISDVIVVKDIRRDITYEIGSTEMVKKVMDGINPFVMTRKEAGEKAVERWGAGCTTIIRGDGLKSIQRPQTSWDRSDPPLSTVNVGISDTWEGVFREADRLEALAAAVKKKI